uniref:Phage terminase large subunit (GpA) protein n=1 Tax=Hydrogenovibrio crunogenus (strain DSM 25203 / XCL-2) TaxID=317025 RepID=Q31HV5_HYDCU
MATLAKAQLERDKIKAKQARKSYELALSESMKTEQAETVKALIRKAVTSQLKKLTKEFSQVVDGQQDETQIHYLLSDYSHDWLKSLGHQVKKQLDTKALGNTFKQSVTPRQLLSVSQWAEKNRYMKTGTNLPGPWRNANAPHAVEIMDSLSVHSPVRTVTFMKASGISGTEIGLNWIGYVIDYAQMDMIFVVPTLELRDRTFNPKLKRLLTETPCLNDLSSSLSRDESNRKDMLELGPMRLIKSGANSAESFRAEHVPYAYGDEIDAFPLDVGGEGDPVTLIENRQKTFSRAKSLYTSTPTERDFSLVEDLFESGDQRYRYIACPECGHRHTLAFKNFRWKLDDKEQQEEGGKKIVYRAYFVCPSCDAEIHEHQKNKLLDEAVWIPNNPSVTKHRSYHLNSFYIKFGLGLTWKDIAQKWLDSQGDTNKLKAFTNTYLAETWREDAERMDAILLLSRIESFPEELPRPTTRIAFTDVQKDRLELTIIDFEDSEEAWDQQHIILPGETALPDVWDSLDEELANQNVVVAGIDAGYNTSMVTDFCKGKKWCIPTKGVGGEHRPLVEDKVKRNQRLRRRRKKGMPIEPIGTDQGKALLFARLNLKPNTERVIDEESGEIIETIYHSTPGYIHFNNDPSLDDEYFNQLTAEELQTKKRAGREYRQWVKTRPRNEALDCFIGALAIFRMAKEMPTIRRKKFVEQTSQEEGNAEQQSQPTKKPIRQRRKLRI